VALSRSRPKPAISATGPFLPRAIPPRRATAPLSRGKQRFHVASRLYPQTMATDASSHAGLSLERRHAPARLHVFHKYGIANRSTARFDIGPRQRRGMTSHDHRAVSARPSHTDGEIVRHPVCGMTIDPAPASRRRNMEDARFTFAAPPGMPSVSPSRSLN
jgi:hypothetical protein